jgi:U3 small nucleolar RNA-associated protein MPP10
LLLQGEESDDEDGQSGSEEEGSDNEASGAKRTTGASAAATKANRRETALSAQIAQLEGELMADKPWELRGEVKGAERPENSFLSLHADIER